MKPKGILSFWNVPEGVNPDYEVYRNGVLMAEGAGMGMIVKMDQDTHKLDHTWQQIYDALKQGTLPFVTYSDNDEAWILPLTGANIVSTNWYIYANGDNVTPFAAANSADDYPLVDTGE